MKSLILVAVILQLVIIGIKTVDNYQFGDIIEFPKACINNKPTLCHFAIYVGKGTNVAEWRDVGQGDNDIFHRTGKLGKPDCTFGKLADTRKGSKDRKYNYLDEDIPREYSTSQKIMERITEKKKKCDKYGLIANNCEHLATDMRYGEPLALQKGTRAECFLKTNNAKYIEIQNKYKAEKAKEDEKLDENNNAPCGSGTS